MVQNIKKIFNKQGFIRLKGVLDYKEDLEPVLNDMAFIMDRLVHRFVPKKDKVKVLKYNFDGKFVKEFNTIKAAADSEKTNTANIQRCIDKKGYSSHQHYWFRKKSSKIKKKIRVPVFI